MICGGDSPSVEADAPLDQSEGGRWYIQPSGVARYTEERGR